MTDSLITIAEARDRVLRQIKPQRSERLAVGDALDRVLAEPVLAAGDVPPFPCSAMDGYAIIAGPAGRSLALVGESRAGAPTERILLAGEAIRISTGAAVPAGATAVVRQEDVVAGGDQTVRIEVDVDEGSNVREAGEDMRGGTMALPAGTLLGAAELGAAVAAGVGDVVVACKPRVRVLCTGDELRAPGEPLGPGEIHNSNAPMLEALARHAGGEPTARTQRLPDDRKATESALGEAIEHADVVIVTGGVSVGPHDHVKPALANLGVSEQFWGVSLQPGKPTWFGTRDGTLVFGLPGNPVSAVVTFSLFVAPAISAMLGAAPTRMLDKAAVLGEPVKRNPVREQAVRVRLERRDAETVAWPNGAQGSHILTSLIGADALAMIPPGQGELEAGTEVTLTPLLR